MDIHPEYTDGLLKKAVDLADRLVPSFESGTGIPYPRVKLSGGPPFTNRSDTTIASATSLILEFGTLSALTGNQTYSNLALGSIGSG